MDQCLFCQISSGKVSTNYEYNDDQVVAFLDLHPKAPIHILIVPKKHVSSVDALEPDDFALVGHMIKIAQTIARDKKINHDGYRLVFNIRSHAGQTIDHIHLHLLGGQKLGSMA